MDDETKKELYYELIERNKSTAWLFPIYSLFFLILSAVMAAMMIYRFNYTSLTSIEALRIQIIPLAVNVAVTIFMFGVSILFAILGFYMHFIDKEYNERITKLYNKIIEE